MFFVSHKHTPPQKLPPPLAFEQNYYHFMDEWKNEASHYWTLFQAIDGANTLFFERNHYSQMATFSILEKDPNGTTYDKKWSVSNIFDPLLHNFRNFLPILYLPGNRYQIKNCNLQL